MLLPVGTPLWKLPSALNEAGKSRNTVAALPEDVTAAHNVFDGATIRANEDTAMPLAVARTGRLLVRVHGGASGVASGDTVVQDSDGNEHLVKSGTGGNDANVVGQTQAAVPVGEVRLIPVLRGGGGGGGGGGGTDAVWS